MRLAFVFACHAVCAISLTLLNKRIAVQIHYPWIVVVIQCAGSVLISIIVDLPYATVRLPRWKQLPGMLLISFLFTMSLVSSISGLRRVHVPMAVVGKNITPFITALLEMLLLSAPVRTQSAMSLTIGIFGGVLYLYGDANASTDGLMFVLLNALCVAVTAISEKVVTQRKEQSPRALGLYRNAFAVPFVAAIIFLDRDGTSKAMQAIAELSGETLGCMALASIFGSLGGTLLFELQTRVSAATTQVAALTYKLATTLLSLLLFPASRKDVGWLALVGYSLSTVSVALYVFLPQRTKPKNQESKTTI